MIPAPVRTLAAAAAVAFALLAGARDAGAGSETPPKGPPWVRDFHAAQATALAEGKPVFVYMTKTH
jgi:hypothetical protein